MVQKQKKKIPRWMIVIAIVIVLMLALFAYCFNMIEGDNGEYNTISVQRVDSDESDVSMVGNSYEIAPCEKLNLHIKGIVSAGEITIAVYDDWKGEINRTSDGAVVWTVEDEYHPVYTETFHEGAEIDQWIEIERENKALYCDYSIIVTSPTNTEIEATITEERNATWYGWQEVLTSPLGKSFAKLLQFKITGRNGDY